MEFRPFVPPVLFVVLACAFPRSAAADLVIGGDGNIVLAEEGGNFAADNLAPGGTAFAFDLLGNGSFVPTHDIPNLNDSTYGNSNSWIGETAGTSCGISLGAAPVTIASIAFGRDNGGEAQVFTDRTPGLYILQFTQVANPDEATADTGEPTTGWADIGTLEYGPGAGGTIYTAPYLRHRYNIDPIDATGIRIVVPLGGIGGGTCIDEIELYATPSEVQEPPPIVQIVSEPGFSITYDGNDGVHFDPTPPPAGAVVPDNLSLAGEAFGSGELQPGGLHQIIRVNDGFYGNSNSWIGAGAPGQFIGVALGGEFAIDAIAFGRDNGNGAFDDSDPGTDCCGGQVDDRSLGVYTVQITTDADPATTDSWVTIGTVGYSVTEDRVPGEGFTPWFRHEFGVTTEGGEPLTAAGVRLLVPNPGIAIDELEIYAPGDAPVPQLSPVEEGGESETANNLAAAGTAFAKDVLAGRNVDSLNDGVSGDASAWAGSSPDSFAGVGLGADLIPVRSIAFGRDNTGAMTDRSLGTYVLQFTEVAAPDETTPDASWTTIGEIVYEVDNPPSAHLRHRFNFGAVSATGVRLLTPDGGAIDEFEVYADRYVPPPPPALNITPAAGFVASWDGNDGVGFDATPPPDGALVADNLALASNGAVPFASSDLGPELGIDFHVTSNLNDGFYGNANSWISASANETPQAFAGITFGTTVALTGIAWGRDNGNGAFDDSDPGSDACGGQCDDRSFGVYTLQFTDVPAPDADTRDESWTSIAEFEYSAAGETDDVPGELFTEWLRHEFAVGTADGGPILATGIRILVPLAGLNGGTAIDEIEVYGPVVTDPFEITEITLNADTDEIVITFNSEPGASYALDASTMLHPLAEPGGWIELGDFSSTGTSTTVCIIPAGGASSCPPERTLFSELVPERFFRVRKF